MSTPSISIRLAGLACCLALAACSSTQPIPYSGINSSSQMLLNQRDATGRKPYEYKTDTNWNNYAAVIIDPVIIYRGGDGQFEDVAEEDRIYLARYMQSAFKAKLDTRFRSVMTPAQNALRIKLTLAGARENTPFLSTLSRFDLLGGPYNATQAIRGKEGAMTGSVSFVVEIYDSWTNVLLGAYVSKQYPNAWNLKAGIGAMSASEAGIDIGAEDLLSFLR
ncbi:DUF3313 domain-containing protein [Undibacterium sp. CY18W]|uniref:DUF3313 domain-containing protein n=1 Tax=Undibacterium hunanense TaxID=2762292 RepID=A0ABR6ZVT0_9BURK|nr:DUF3313 domain-containing protein [Undibacterium hunanense]MBC3919620.1 DUF3313 domain-containing protein [Undibacterium hunanense]